MNSIDRKRKGITTGKKPIDDRKINITITIKPSVLKALDERFGGSRSAFVESAILNELNRESFQ